MTGTPELLIIVLIVLLLFGASWLPKLARRAGRSTVEVQKARRELETTRDQLKETTAPITDSVTKINKAMKTSPTDLAKQALLSDRVAAAAEDVPAGALGPGVADDVALAELASVDEESAETHTRPEASADQAPAEDDTSET